MCGSMADIQSATAEIRRGKKKKEDRTRMRHCALEVLWRLPRYINLLTYLFTYLLTYFTYIAQRNGRPAEYRWRPLFNAAKFG